MGDVSNRQSGKGGVGPSAGRGFCARAPNVAVVGEGQELAARDHRSAWSSLRAKAAPLLRINSRPLLADGDAKGPHLAGRGSTLGQNGRDVVQPCSERRPTALQCSLSTPAGTASTAGTTALPPRGRTQPPAAAPARPRVVPLSAGQSRLPPRPSAGGKYACMVQRRWRRRRRRSVSLPQPIRTCEYVLVLGKTRT